MAKQKYLTGGENKTPAPTRPAAPDVVSSIRAPSKASYGMNGYSGSSSADPGFSVTSPLADNLKASSDDGTLDKIIKGGAAGGDDWQTRKLDNSNVPVHSAMEKRGIDSGSPGGTVPAKNGNPSSNFDTRRARQR